MDDKEEVNSVAEADDPNCPSPAQSTIEETPNTVHDPSQSWEPSVSAVEMELLLRSALSEKKTNQLQITHDDESEITCQEEHVGDDAGSKKMFHILCECDEPSPRGGAVPIAIPYVDPPGTSDLKTENIQSTKTKPRSISFSSQERMVISNDDDTVSSDDEQRHDQYRRLINNFSTEISKLAQETTDLLETVGHSDQMKLVEDMNQKVSNLKYIVAELKKCQSSKSEPELLQSAKTKSKENSRIHIKFLPSKSAVKKKRNETEDYSVIADTDSMDGMFIPVFEGSPEIEDDDDEEGLDITIRFPEQQKLEATDSHLSVCFSSISAEALGRLKRCPKEFILRMDFIQGKMFFQTGTSPANSYSIGPDLKITECAIDSKKSDIISIKPSTECLYASQIISVEGAPRQDSLKTLKSTDSELFSVVSMPEVPKRRSGTTKSCITLKTILKNTNNNGTLGNDNSKSLPQITSVSNITEEVADDDKESVNSTATTKKKTR